MLDAPQTDAEIAAQVRHQERLIRQALDALTQGYWLQALALLQQAQAIEDRLDAALEDTP